MKFLFRLFFLLLCLNKCSAQIQFGIKGGFNLSRIPYPEAPSHLIQTNLTAFNAGVIASRPISKHLSIQTEIVYSVQGSSETNQGPPEDEEIIATFKYLNIPILLVYGHQSGFFAETGPQLGIFLNGRTDYGADLHVKADNVQPIDVAWVIGLGYRISGINLGLDARYNIGFTAINKYAYPGESSWYNRVFQFDVFYVFKKL